MSIADELNTLVNCKEDMKSALIEKGVTPEGGLSTYADAIRLLYNEYNDLNFDAIGGDNNTILHSINGINNAIKQSIRFVNRCINNGEDNFKAVQFPSDKSYVGDNIIFFPKINFINKTNYNYFLAYNRSLCYMPQIDTSNATSMQGMFRECNSLTTIPQLDTSKVTDMCLMFYNCYSLINIPQLDTSKVTNMHDMFYGCKSFTAIPQLDTSKVTDMSAMFSGCNSLIEVPQLDTSSATDMLGMFSDCNSLTSIPELDCSSVINIDGIFFGCYHLMDVGGFKNLGKQPELAEDSIDFCLGMNLVNDSYEPDLIALKQSAVNIINNLYDRASAGFSVISIYFYRSFGMLLSDNEIAVATNKGWNIIIE